MTKMHFTRAAEMVNSIRQGDWTTSGPAWSRMLFENLEIDTREGNVDSSYVRAVWTAEAFILLFREYNPRFNEAKFLKACGFPLSVR